MNGATPADLQTWFSSWSKGSSAAMYRLDDTLSAADLFGKRVLLRVDYNVPLQDGRIEDDTRIVKTLPTLKLLISKGAQTIVISHLGRPKGKVVPELSLLPVAKHLERILGKEVKFASECVGVHVQQLAETLKPGDVMLLENLRFYEGEEKNDPAFADALASLADVYVNDAFSASHRAHASTSGLASRLMSYPGLLLLDELKAAYKIMENPARPYVAILGGAKVSTKIEVVRRLLEITDRVLIGGAMLVAFLRAKGYMFSSVTIDENEVDQARAILGSSSDVDAKLVLPLDVVVAKSIDNPESSYVCEVSDTAPPNDSVYDIGPKTVEAYIREIDMAKTIMWNGPVGVFEKGFSEGTSKLVEALCNANGYTYVGGGDTIAALKRYGDEQRISFVSTGGGASLEFIAYGRLPALDALFGLNSSGV